MKNISLMPGLLTIALLACCETAIDKHNEANLAGRWVLDNAHIVNNGNTGHKVDPKPYLKFDTKKHMVSGYSGCNSFSGEFHQTKDSLEFRPLIATQRGCLGGTEARIFEGISSARAYRATRNTLKLLSGDTVVLSFVRDVSNE